MKGHKISCEEEIEGKLEKLKKIEALIIKRLMRINSQLLTVIWWSYLSILSLSYSCTLRAFLEHSNIGERNAKEGQGSKVKKGSNNEKLDGATTIGLLCRYRFFLHY